MTSFFFSRSKILFYCLFSFLLPLNSSYASQEANNMMRGAHLYSIAKSHKSADRETYYIPSEYGRIFFSYDNGEYFHLARTDTKQNITSIKFQNKDIGYAVGHDSIILKTTDGGFNWSTIYSESSDEKPLFKVYIKGNNIFAIGAYGLFLYSYDDGEHWEKISIDNNKPHLYDISFISDSEFYLVGESGYFSKGYLENNRIQIEKINTPYQGSYFGLCTKSSPGEVLLYGLRGNLYIYSPDLENFKKISQEDTHALFTSLRIDKRVIFAGQGGYIISKNMNSDLISYHHLDDHISITGMKHLKGGMILLTTETGIRYLHKSEIY